MPDIDLDFPRDIREKLIVAVTERYGQEHAALVATLRHLPLARRDPRGGEGARPAAGRDRAARPHVGGLGRPRRRAGARVPAGRRREAPLAALAGVRRALRGDRGPPAPHLPAPGRDDHLLAAARRARSGRARRHGGAPALPVGQGLVLRRRLPQDRPARPRDALRRRGVRRRDRPPPPGADRPFADPARRRGRLRRDPRCRHRRGLPDREPGADAEPAPHPPREPRRPDDPGRARPARGRFRAAPSTRTSSGASAGARTPTSYRPTTTRSLAEPLARDPRRRRLPGAGARGRDGARGLHRRARRRGSAAR